MVMAVSKREHGCYLMVDYAFAPGVAMAIVDMLQEYGAQPITPDQVPKMQALTQEAIEAALRASALAGRHIEEHLFDDEDDDLNEPPYPVVQSEDDDD